MKDKIAIIGHVDNGKTTLASAIITSLSKNENESKTINEIIEDQNIIPFNAPQRVELTPWIFKSGQESRRERRAKERKNKP